MCYVVKLLLQSIWKALTSDVSLIFVLLLLLFFVHITLITCDLLYKTPILSGFAFASYSSLHNAAIISFTLLRSMGSGIKLTNDWLTFYDTILLSVISYMYSRKGIVIQSNTFLCCIYARQLYFCYIEHKCFFRQLVMALRGAASRLLLSSQRCSISACRAQGSATRPAPGECSWVSFQFWGSFK